MSLYLHGSLFSVGPWRLLKVEDKINDPESSDLVNEMAVPWKHPGKLSKWHDAVST